MFDFPDFGIRLRAFGQPTDLDNLMKQGNDTEIAPLLTLRFIVPRGDEAYREMLKNDYEKKTEMCCVVETIPSTKDESPEYVGTTALWKSGEPGMRHVQFSIVLEKKFWGKGLGKKLTNFMVDYAFRNLNMHRIGLGVFEGNDRALAVYKKWCATFSYYAKPCKLNFHSRTKWICVGRYREKVELVQR